MLILYTNIGIRITGHNVQETLSITDRAYHMFEGSILYNRTQRAGICEGWEIDFRPPRLPEAKFINKS